MNKYNLIEEPWLPTVKRNGTPELVSLRQLFTSAAEYQEIIGTNPLETAALYRLLWAIMIRAVHTPKYLNQRDFNKLVETSLINNDLSFVLEYLDKWKDRFNLFDETRPFMQVAGLSNDESKTVKQIMYEVASGANHTILSWTTDNEDMYLSYAQAAVKLIARHAFTIGGTGAQSIMVNDIKVDTHRSGAQSLAFNSYLTWTQEKNLLQTLLINLPYTEDNDIAAWEYDNDFEALGRNSWTDTSDKRVSFRGVADYYTSVTHMARLVPSDDDLKVSRMFIANGRQPDQATVLFDPMVPYFISAKDQSFEPVKPDIKRGMWRDANTITCRSAGNKIPRVFDRRLEMVDSGLVSDIVTIQTVFCNNKNSKILGWQIASLSLSTDWMTSHTNGEITYDPVLVRMIETVNGYALNYYSGSLAKELMRACKSIDTKKARALLENSFALEMFWSRLEHAFIKTLSEIRALQSDDIESKLIEWENIVNLESNRAKRMFFKRYSNTYKQIQACGVAFSSSMPETFEKNDEENLQPFVKHLLGLKSATTSKERAVLSAFRRSRYQTRHECQELFDAEIAPYLIGATAHEKDAAWGLAGLFSVYPEHNRYVGGFGRSMKRLSDNYSLDSLTKDLCKMVVAPSRRELITHLAQIIPMMKAKQIDINWSRLYNDILFWGDSSTTQFAWTKQFFATPVAKKIKGW